MNVFLVPSQPLCLVFPMQTGLETIKGNDNAEVEVHLRIQILSLFDVYRLHISNLHMHT
jgi:hypothetical protein